MSAKQKLKLGVIANARGLLAWQAECLRLLLESGTVELKLLATTELPSMAAQDERRWSPEKVRSLPFAGNLRISGEAGRAGRLMDFDAQLKTAEHFKLQRFSGDNSAPYASEEDIAKVSSHKLDFVLALDPPILSGKIVRAARFGVWSFRHGNGKHYGEPPAFWEVYHGEPLVNARLQRLTERSNEAVTLYDGFFPAAASSWRLTSELVLFGCVEWPIRVCKDILNGCADYLDGKPSPVDPPAHRKPTKWQATVAALRTCNSFVHEQLRSLLVREQWHVGIVRAPIQSFVDGHEPAVEWLQEPSRTRFFADPFVLKRGPEVGILFEDFDQIERNGHISATYSTDEGRSFSPPARITGSTFGDAGHKSYPYLFQHDGQIYCVPETCEANEVGLFRALEFPWRWERVCKLLEGVPAVDPTVLHYDGYWWIFYTLRGPASNIKLYLASAPELSGPWSPHPANPLKTDIRGARPAGTPFLLDGVLFRPSQDSTHTYGGALVIHRVERLTLTEYRESAVCRITLKSNDLYSRGIHTLAAAGDFCVVDGKRFILIPQILPAMILEKISAALRRIART